VRSDTSIGSSGFKWSLNHGGGALGIFIFFLARSGRNSVLRRRLCHFIDSPFESLPCAGDEFHLIHADNLFVLLGLVFGHEPNVDCGRLGDKILAPEMRAHEYSNALACESRDSLPES